MNIMIIAPHPDDEVLGCGGTIAKYAENGHKVYVVIVTKGTEPIFSEEITLKTREECIRADEFLGVTETIFLDFPAVRMEEIQRFKINNALVDIIQKKKPEIVYVPHRGDMQLDHKLTTDAAMVALRPKYDHVPKKIYAYETVSETGWDLPNVVNEFIPNSYNDISNYISKKLHAVSIFETQTVSFPGARSVEAVKALAVYRGSTMNMQAAEAFTLIRELSK